MNRIEFRRGGVIHNPQYDEVRVFIDDTDLVDLLCEVEGASRVIAHDWGEIPRYSGLPPTLVCAPSRHYFGEPASPLYQFGDRIQILECGCREPGCDPVHCHIAVNDQTVVWSQFGWGHFPELGEAFPGKGLGPFVFARAQLLEALESLGPAA